MTRNKVFTFFLSGVLAGILIFQGLEDIFLSLFFLLWCIVLCISWCLFLHSSLQKAFFLVFLSLGIGMLSWIGYSYYWDIERQGKIDLIDQSMWLYLPMQAYVSSVDSRKEFYDVYEMHLYKLGENSLEKENIHFLLRVPKNFILFPWEYISYSGKLYEIEDFDGFSYKNFMLSRGIYFSTSANTFSRDERKKKDFFYSISIFRTGLLGRISTLFPEREAVFLGWILFWARENIDPTLKTQFNNSWLTHFIAVSGFNITLCVTFMTLLLAMFPKWIRIFWVIWGILAFSFFVGLWAPVVRAAIMGILGFIFLQSENKAENITLFVFTAVLMWLYSPLSLSYDVSLHLSFFAVLGIMYTQDFFKKIFFFIPEFFAIQEAFVLTLSALVFTLPIMMFQFGQVSLLAPLANIMVTWTIPLAMLGGALVLIIDVFSQSLASTLWIGEWILLRYDIAMVEFFGTKDWALLKFDFWPYKNYGMMLYFLLTGYIVFLWNYKKKQL